MSVIYKSLQEAIEALPKMNTLDHVTVYDPEEDEYYEVAQLCVQTEEQDVLDKGHLFLVLKK